MSSVTLFALAETALRECSVRLIKAETFVSCLRGYCQCAAVT